MRQFLLVLLIAATIGCSSVRNSQPSATVSGSAFAPSPAPAPPSPAPAPSPAPTPTPAPAPAPTFSDQFNTGQLDTSKWIVSNWGAPGSIPGVNQGTFTPTNVDLSQGVLRLKLEQQEGTNGVISTGAELQSSQAFGFGTYEWIIRTSSTSATPYGDGRAVSGQISSGFTFIDASTTEIDFEIEGQKPSTVWMTNWSGTALKQASNSSLQTPEAGFHKYKLVWSPTEIDFYIDDVLVSTHTENIPQVPAYVMINHWGTNSTGWGGLATVGVTRYMYVSSFTYTAL